MLFLLASLIMPGIKNLIFRLGIYTPLKKFRAAKISTIVCDFFLVISSGSLDSSVGGGKLVRLLSCCLFAKTTRPRVLVRN